MSAVRPTPPLLAVAHGSRDPRAAAAVEALLVEVRRRRPGVAVSAAYLDHAFPTVSQALDTLTGSGEEVDEEVVVLPLLLTAAYHSKTDLPDLLGTAMRRRPGLRVHYGDTLGPHDGLLAGMERRLAGSGVRPRDPDTAVVLAAAGSSEPYACRAVARMARAWARRGWWAVSPAYASAAPPTPAEAVLRLRDDGARRVAVASYLLSPGYFADTVREGALAAGAAAVSPALGPAPEVADVVMQRYDEALRHRYEAVAAAG